MIKVLIKVSKMAPMVLGEMYCLTSAILLFYFACTVYSSYWTLPFLNTADFDLAHPLLQQENLTNKKGTLFGPSTNTTQHFQDKALLHYMSPLLSCKSQ